MNGVALIVPDALVDGRLKAPLKTWNCSLFCARLSCVLAAIKVSPNELPFCFWFFVF